MGQLDVGRWSIMGKIVIPFGRMNEKANYYLNRGRRQNIGEKGNEMNACNISRCHIGVAGGADNGMIAFITEFI